MLCGQRRSWRQRRNYKLWLIWIALASLGAVVPFALSSLKALGLQGLDPQSAVKAVESWKGWRELLFQGPQPSSFEDWLNGHPNISVALAGFLFIGLPLTTMRASLHDRFFASFNDDVLRPVLSLRKPNPDQNDASHIVWLPWVLGKTGARRVAWDTLKAWVNGVAAPASIKVPRPHLSIALLVGRPGSGKTRMAHEFARDLARRDLLGSDKPNAKLRWRTGVYLRRCHIGFSRKVDDPWDAGLLAKGEEDASFNQTCARLRK
jgi:hypothetical protein